MTLYFGRNLAYLRKLNRLEQKDIAKLVSTGFRLCRFCMLFRAFCVIFGHF